MSQKNVKNVGASVRQKLLNRARADGRPYQAVAQLYAMERFLFRLGASDVAERFILKGGLMTMTWAAEYARLTKDIDLLGRGASSVDDVVASMKRVLHTEVSDDGVAYDSSSVSGARIMVDAVYVGVRVKCVGDIGGMVVRLQLDVGFGDAVVPPPQWIDYPQLLEAGRPRILGYPIEATLAEKLHAACYHGDTNTRLKDYYDLWTAHRLEATTPASLAVAIRHTFDRRDSPVPRELPLGLSPSFGTRPDKQALWHAFLARTGARAPSLPEVLDEIRPWAMAAFVLA